MPRETTDLKYKVILCPYCNREWFVLGNKVRKTCPECFLKPSHLRGIEEDLWFGIKKDKTSTELAPK
jgi:hypothetical protein